MRCRVVTWGTLSTYLIINLACPCWERLIRNSTSLSTNWNLTTIISRFRKPRKRTASSRSLNSIGCWIQIQLNESALPKIFITMLLRTEILNNFPRWYKNLKLKIEARCCKYSRDGVVVVRGRNSHQRITQQQWSTHVHNGRGSWRRERLFRRWTKIG
jgi:hypothetical protein